MKEIKQLYDPTNLFRNSLWPLDESGTEVEAHTHEPPTPKDAGTDMIEALSDPRE